MSEGKPWRDADTLKELYHDKELTPPEIGEELGVSRHTIYKYLDRYDIEKVYRCDECGKEYKNAQSVRSHKRTHKDAPYKDADKIRELYHGEKMTARDVAGELECSIPTLRKWMDKLGVERRSHMEVIKNQWRLEPPEFTSERNGYEIIRTQFEGETDQFRHHRLIAVAKHGFDAVKDKEVHHKSGVEWDNRHGNLELLTTAEHMAKHREDNLSSRENIVSKEACETFREKYPAKTFKEIGNEHGCWQGTVHYHVAGECQH